MTGVRTVAHIGADKTGSTAIQRAMATNRNRLAELGVWYPDLDGRPDHRLLLASPTIGPEVPTGIDDIVLSAEALWSADRATIDGLLGGLPAGPVTVVGFLRDPVDHAEAAFRQRLRLSRSERELWAVLALRAVPARVNPIAGRARRRLAQLERWVAAVDAATTAPDRGDHGRGPVELIIRPYRPNEDVVVELCRAAGLDRLIPVLAERPDPRPNPRLDLDTIHASVLVRQRSGPEAQVRFLDAAGAGPGSAGGDAPLLPPALRASIRTRTQPILSRLDHRLSGPHLSDGIETEPADTAVPTRSAWPANALDRDRARALVTEIWPGFPSGGPNPPN